ncbi:MAG TPA: AAA family ATPase [Spirochaetales bacterium]|nr:AAA family ATPase [Spirochaetales bacterium]
MLINFTVSNFKSIKDEILFNMAPAKRLQTMKEHVLVANTKKKAEGMPVAAIYGANGSGKTNFIEALAFMKDRINNDDVVAAIPFRLADDDQEKQPSTFSVLFSFEKVVYAYGFSIEGRIVRQEWLSAYYTAKETMLFERYWEGEGTQIVFGNRLVSDTKGGKAFLGFIFQGIQKEQLFLREAVKRDVSLLEPVEQWFVSHVFVIRPTSRAMALEVTLQNKPKALQKMNEQLHEMGMNLEKLETKEKKFNSDQYANQLDEGDAERFRNALEGLQEGEIIELSEKSFGRPQYIKKKNDEFYLISFEVCHERQDGKQVNFDISTASSGFMRMLDLLPALDVAQQEDTLIVVDEIERSLHTLLSQYFISCFIGIVTESQNGSQLVFSTHDTNLLDSDFLRSDEIWFMEKDSSSSSRLCNLVEFKQSTGLNYEKGYLEGRFGAIPIFHGNGLRLK